MILLSVCAADFAVLHCKGEETKSKLVLNLNNIKAGEDTAKKEAESKDTAKKEAKFKDTAKKEVESKAGDLLELTIENVKWRFHYCPARTFKMGEGSVVHKVTLTQGFWMGETEVTQEQWESIMGDNPSTFKGAKLPVECVSWNDCQAFIEKLNALLAPAPAVLDTPLALGLKAELPTEARWEYACRAGSTKPYSAGKNANEMGWYGGNSDGKTHEVGKKAKNVWGLYDMHGNVFEWCNDLYWYSSSISTVITNHNFVAQSGNSREVRGIDAEINTVVAQQRSIQDIWNIEDAQRDRERAAAGARRAAERERAAAERAKSDKYRVIRGGNWFNGAEYCRSAYRGLLSPDEASDRVGVRVSLVSGK